MLLRHKVLALTHSEHSKEQTAPLFRDLIKQYSTVFISVATLVFDLAPYVGYLSECTAA